MGFFIIYHTVRVVTLAVYHICPKLLIPYLVAPSYWAANPCRLEVVGARILALRQLFLKRSHLFLGKQRGKQRELFLGGRVSVGIGSLPLLLLRRRRLGLRRIQQAALCIFQKLLHGVLECRL